jgi:CspA family cold shock protein
MPTGSCKWFRQDKGYGFITEDGTGKDFFIHFENIQMDGFKVLQTGEKVEFEPENAEKGWMAINVRKL